MDREMDKKIPLVIHYSWYEAPTVRLYDTFDEAKTDLKTFFDEEVRIDTEENGHEIGFDMDVKYDEKDGTFASITLYFDDCTDVIEWEIGFIQSVN